MGPDSINAGWPAGKSFDQLTEAFAGFHTCGMACGGVSGPEGLVRRTERSEPGGTRPPACQLAGRGVRPPSSFFFFFRSRGV